jgi:hypothetical protein
MLSTSFQLQIVLVTLKPISSTDIMTSKQVLSTLLIMSKHYLLRHTNQLFSLILCHFKMKPLTCREEYKLQVLEKAKCLGK